ncbi:MAG: GH3 auxin-responsive promoter family protein, partial [Nonlabens sp.]
MGSISFEKKAMALLGPIIKTALNVHDYITSTADHVKAQTAVLDRLLNTASKTSFGIYYGFEEILGSDDVNSAFAKAVPFHDYHKMDEEWWQQMKKGKKDISWPGLPKY